MSFLPKDLLYTDNSYQESSKNLLSAIELLEKAQENKKEIDKENKENKSFWHKMGNFLNPFKCGNAGA
jgi:Tfp pilus assembly protein PilV